jgi:putative transposase
MRCISEHKVENRAVYSVLGVTLEGHKDVLGHWLGDGVEGASFWLSVLTDLKTAPCKLCSSRAWMA